MSKTRQRKQSTYNEGVTDRKQGKKPFRHKYREYDVKPKDFLEKLLFIDEQEQMKNK